MSTKYPRFHVKANQREVAGGEKRGEKPERNIEPRTAAGGGGGIYKDNRKVGSEQQAATSIAESAHGGIGQSTPEAYLAGGGPESTKAPVSYTKDSTLEHSNNKTDLSGKFLPTSNLKDANQTFPPRDYFCRVQNDSAARKMVAMHGLA